MRRIDVHVYRVRQAGPVCSGAADYGIIFFMEGCMSTNVRIIHDEIPCVMTETHFGVWQGNSIYERQQIDCSDWGEEDWKPNVRTPKTEANNDTK